MRLAKSYYKYFIIVLTLLIVISTVSLFVWNQARVKPILIDIISMKDRQKLGELVLMIASNPGDLKTVYNSFWDVLEKYDVISEFHITDLKEETNDLFFLPKLFYEDALKTINRKSPFKSVDREKVEKRFLEEGFLTKLQIQNDKETMDLIAQMKPLKAAHGVEIFIDETRINEMLKEWSDREMVEIIDKLFMPRAKGNSP